MINWVLGLLACFSAMLSVGQVIDVVPQKPNHQKPFAESVAIYEYLRGNEQEAILVLSENSGVQIGEMNATNRDLFRLEQLQHLLSTNLDQDLPDAVNDDLWLKIADLRRRANDCHGAVSALTALKSDDLLINHRQLFQRITCMLEQHNPSAPILHAAEQLIPEIETPSIWLAYIYNNMAVKAQQVDEYLLAQGYFNQALLYVDSSKEGQSLASFIRLSLAYSYFSDNRFNFALKSFAELKETSEWIDLGLLGFGWAAYRNNQSGLALEAWRQLVKLPFQSIHVYEGYIAIPFALEKQNAYVDAFNAYDNAIKEFGEVNQTIAKLENRLDKQQLLKHVLDYKNDDNKRVTPLDPLLVYAFAEASFQDVFDTIEKTDQYLDQIATAKSSITLLRDYQQRLQQAQAQKRKRINALQNTIIKKLDGIQRKMVFSANDLLVSAFRQQPSHNLYPIFKRYQQVANQYQADQSKISLLQRLRGVLIGRLQEDNLFYVEKNLPLVTATQQFSQLNQDFHDAIKLRQRLKPQYEARMQNQWAKLDLAEQQIKQVQDNAVTLLQQKTFDTLAHFKSQLKIYETQARVALTRISEDFYQQGGQRL